MSAYETLDKSIKKRGGDKDRFRLCSEGSIIKVKGERGLKKKRAPLLAFFASENEKERIIPTGDRVFSAGDAIGSN